MEMHLSLPMLNVGGIFKDVEVGKMEPTSTSERQPRTCTMSPFILCEANKSRSPEQRATPLVCRFRRARQSPVRTWISGLKNLCA